MDELSAAIRSVIREKVARQLAALYAGPIPMTPGDVPWLTIAEAAARSHRHPDTILKALQDRSLHGQQRSKGGRWTIRQVNLDAWLVTAQEHLLGVREAATRLGERPKTIYEWRRVGKGPTAARVGRLVKFRAKDLDAWLAESRE